MTYYFLVTKKSIFLANMQENGCYYDIGNKKPYLAIKVIKRYRTQKDK